MGRKRTLPYLTLIVAILALAALILTKELFFDAKPLISNIKRMGVEKELTPISVDSILLTDNGIMVEGESTNLRARNMEGNVLWSMKLNGNISSIKSCGNAIVVNIENKNISTISRSGEMLWQYEMAVPASDILYSENGLLLIQYNEAAYNSFEIFNINGVRSCTAIINDAHVISFDGISGKYYTLSLLDASSQKVLSKIATYNNKSEILWANNYEDILIPRVKYNARGELVVITEKSINKIKPDGKLDKSVDFSDDIVKVSAGEGLLAAVVKKQGFYDVLIYDYNLKQIGTSALKTKPEGVFTGNDYLLLYNKDNITLLNRQGKITAVHESNIDINSAYINDNDRIYIISNRKMQKLAF